MKTTSKITNLRGAAKFSKEKRSEGQTVGLVVGSFDILHLGHTNLFRFAKKYVDVLIAGLDNDETIRLVKGKNRPVNNYSNRAKLLSDLVTVDRIFLIERTSHHDSEEAQETYSQLITEIRPTHIFTHKICDKHWQEKKRIAMKNGIVFLLDRSKRITNSGVIIDKLSSKI